VSWVSTREVARPQPSPARPGSAWPGPARPWRPLLSSLSHLDFPRSNLSSPSLSLSLPWCPRVWSQESPELDPDVSPSPLLSLSPSSLPLRARPCAAARPAFPCGGARPAPLPPPPWRRSAPLPPPWWCSAPPLPRRGRAAPARFGPGAASPAPGAQPQPPARDVPALGVVRVDLAWPRASSFTP
jgi:hypothetical protein